VRTTRAGTQIVVRFEQTGADGSVAVEQWWTMVLLGLDGLADLGTLPSDHQFPDDARAHPLGSATQHIDKRTAHRYATVSGDWSAHHFDIEVARAAGFDFRLHPRAVHHGDLRAAPPRRARRRRSRPGWPGSSAVRIADAVERGPDGECLCIDRNSFAFEATSRGVATITHGRLELRHDQAEIGVFLPQMGFTYAEILHRARRCDALGIDSIWLYDTCTDRERPTIRRWRAWTLATALLSPNRTHPGRTHGAVQSVSAPGGARQDGHHAGPDLGWPPSIGHRERLLEDEHTRVGLTGYLSRSGPPAGRDTGDPEAGVCR